MSSKDWNLKACHFKCMYNIYICMYIHLHIYIQQSSIQYGCRERELENQKCLSFVSRTDIWKQCGLCSILFGKIGPLARICSSHESRIHVGNQSVSTRTANLFWQKHWAWLSFATNLSGHLEQSILSTANSSHLVVLLGSICTTPRSVINGYKLLVKANFFRQFKVLAMASTTSASKMFWTFKWHVEAILC